MYRTAYMQMQTLQVLHWNALMQTLDVSAKFARALTFPRVEEKALAPPKSEEVVQELYGLRLGDVGRYSRVIRSTDITKFVEISGDDNELHTDEDCARTTILGGCVAHGAHVRAFVSAAITKLRRRCIITSEGATKYPGPVRPNDKVDASVRVIKLMPGKNPKAELDAMCAVNDTAVIRYTVVVVIPKT